MTFINLQTEIKQRKINIVQKSNVSRKLNKKNSRSENIYTNIFKIFTKLKLRKLDKKIPSNPTKLKKTNTKKKKKNLKF